MVTRTAVNIGKLIVSRRGVNGGRPCLAGTGMSVRAVAVRHLKGMSAEEILDQFPHLDLARIYAALAYYHANKAAIDADVTADEEFFGALVAKYPHGLGAEVVDLSDLQ